jgi:natural product precursor
MKQKKFSKKLSLGRKTIANLDSRNMDHVKGGAYTDTVCTQEVTCSDPAYCATEDCPNTRPRAICI